MFANTAPFRAAVRERTTILRKDAQDQLYTELTAKFQSESSLIQTRLQQAIRDAKTRRDFRVPIHTYNSVTWVDRTPEALWRVEDEEWEDKVNAIPVHTLMTGSHFLKKLGAFFGDHFTVTVQVHKVHLCDVNYTAVQQTVYLNYWVDKLPPTVLRAREVLTEPPTPIEVNTRVPWCRIEGGQEVWYNP
jgi:hypothetical protein